ncbi:ATP-binding cassette domain-containing protein [Paenibacillus xylanexedens]|uniref:ATP-binding cassette domain-containing protein n=1 Tax=Paenibacillus xylanexedens TaxID=528191 RepID=UPI0011A7BD46|nr:ATP-binding cassette domain-containing protein [Paenibacillus xylanexedens]
MNIELDHVSVAGAELHQRDLIQDISITVRSGEITLLLGRTGSGKTTILQMLAGLKPPDKGTILLGDEPIWQQGKVSQSMLLRMGMVFQFPEQQVFARTIKREFAYSMRPYQYTETQQKQLITQALGQWDSAKGQIDSRQFDLDGSPFALSGGERRRLGLALGTVVDPEWLLLDEPSAGLEASSVLLLLDALAQHRQDGRGAVVATHDLDTFLPIADRVLVLQDGQIVADLTPRELHALPELLIQVGMGLPPSMQLTQQFAAVGLTMPLTALTPEEMAAGIIQLKSYEEAETENNDGEGIATTVAVSHPFHVHQGCTHSDFNNNEHVQVQGHPIDTRSSNTVEHSSQLYRTLDPRLKWILYILLVTATMLQHRWWGLTFTLVPVVLALGILPRQALVSCMKLMKPLLFFFIISTALSGTTLSTASGSLQLGFSLIQAEATLLNVYRLFIVTLASLWFSLTTPYGRMVEGLNWVLAIGQKIKLPVTSFALAVSLIFRFIPMIWSEWQRFSLIVRARGKAALRPNTVRVRDLGPMVIPLIMSLFQRAEDMTIAMEMRKVRENYRVGSTTSLLKWSKQDTWIGVIGLMIFIGYIWIRDL